MSFSYDVRIWKTETYQSKRSRGSRKKPATTYRVRWVVVGRRFGKVLASAALADSFRSQLVAAAGKGEAFDTATGLPVSMTRRRDDMNWYDFACRYVDIKWPDSAPTNRRSIAEAMLAVTMALISTATQGRPPDHGPTPRTREDHDCGHG